MAAGYQPDRRGFKVRSAGRRCRLLVAGCCDHAGAGVPNSSQAVLSIGEGRYGAVVDTSDSGYCISCLLVILLPSAYLFFPRIVGYRDSLKGGGGGSGLVGNRCSNG